MNTGNDDFDSEISGKFTKSRINIIVLSLFIIFYSAGQLKIEKINLLGNQATISNHEIVNQCLVLFFGYFLYRYYTMFIEIRAWRKIVTAITIKFDSYVEKFIKEKYGPNKYKKQFSKTKIKVYSNLHEDILYKNPEEISLFRFSAKYLWSVFYVLFNQSYFTEYLLPYFIAALAILQLNGCKIVQYFF